MRFLHLLCIALFFICSLLNAQQVISLWPNGVPDEIINPNYSERVETKDEAGNPTRISRVTSPSLTIYHAPKENASGAAVLVCPGGGYAILAVQHEGVEVAKWLNTLGITAAVLKYRLPSSDIMKDQKVGPLQDAQRGMRILRENADKWGLLSDKIGVLGFSAGGHLASTLSTHYDNPVYSISSSVSARPDFSILIYPVISFKKSLYHGGSRKKLLGTQETPDQIYRFSNEEWVDQFTPATFLAHSFDDRVVPIENSIVYASALNENGVNVELHAYGKGGHGYGLGTQDTEKNWPKACAIWLKKEILPKNSLDK